MFPFFHKGIGGLKTFTAEIERKEDKEKKIRVIIDSAYISI